MNKLVSITAATIFALTTGIAFAKSEKRDDKDGKRRETPCQEFAEWLRANDTKVESLSFEYYEHLYALYCKKHKDQDEGDGGRDR